MCLILEQFKLKHDSSYILLDNNSFHGSLSPKFGSMLKLEQLSIGKKKTEVSSRKLYEKMLTLYVCYIYRTDHNNLVGTIPSEIGNLTELRSFSFSKFYS